MKELRFAILGTGFWARYQLAGWREVDGARCIALYNRTPEKAHALAKEFGISAVYDSAEKLLEAEKLDFIDIITDVSTPQSFCPSGRGEAASRSSAKSHMAPSIAEAEQMVRLCQRRGAFQHPRELALANAHPRVETGSIRGTSVRFPRADRLLQQLPCVSTISRS